MAYKTNLTPILGEDVDETSAEFMNMKFGELLGNTEDNRQQISILTALQNGWKIYKILSEINAVNTETIPSIAGKMIEGSMLIASIYVPSGTTHYFPITETNGNTFGTLIIHKHSSSRVILEYQARDTSNRWMGSVNASVFTGWKQIATTDKIDFTLLNGATVPAGFVLNAVITGRTVTINGIIRIGTSTQGTTLFVLPVGYRPNISTPMFGFINLSGAYRQFTIYAGGEVQIAGTNFITNDTVVLGFTFNL